MSALEVERQSQSIGASGRSGAKTFGGQGSGAEAGAFGALLEGLGDAPRRGVEGAPAGATTDSGAEAETSSRARMTALFSALGADGPAPEGLAGRLPAVKNQDAGASDESPPAGRERGAASTGPKAGSADLLEALSLPGSKAGSPQETLKAAGAANRHGVSGAGQQGDEESGQPALAADPRLAQTTPDAAAAAMAAIPVAPPHPKPDAAQEMEARSRGGVPGSAPPSAEEEGEGKSAGPAPIRVTVLSRETHFAPVREATLPGATQAAQPFALPGSVAGVSPAGGTAGAQQHESAKEISSEGAEADASERVERRSALRAERHEEMKSVGRDGSAGGRQDVGGRGAEQESAASTPASTPATATGNAQQWMATAQQGLPLSNLRQVSDAIGAEIARMANPAAAAAGDLARAQGPVRLLDIQLNPSDLGIVTVRLRVSGSGLEVKLQASNPETARLLKQDQARLAEMLRSEGVEAADVSVVDGSDGGASWTRFEMMPRQPAAAMPAARQGEDQRSSDQRQGDDSSRNGRNGDEDASGGNRPGRDRG